MIRYAWVNNSRRVASRVLTSKLWYPGKAAAYCDVSYHYGVVLKVGLDELTLVTNSFSHRLLSSKLLLGIPLEQL